MKLLSPRTLWTTLLLAGAAVVINTTNVYSQSYAALTGHETAALAQRATSQVNMRLTGNLNLYGTSTLHNWEMKTTQLQGNAQFNIGENNELSSVAALTFILPVKNLKGEKDGMNDNAYEALNADKYKDIRFVMTTARVDNNGGGKYTIHANGNLTIAGATRPIALEVKTQMNQDGTINCTGTYALKMSEFNIDRPSFMFGAMKTGDALTLSYSLLFVK